MCLSSICHDVAAFSGWSVVNLLWSRWSDLAASLLQVLLKRAFIVVDGRRCYSVVHWVWQLGRHSLTQSDTQPTPGIELAPPRAFAL